MKRRSFLTLVPLAATWPAAWAFAATPVIDVYKSPTCGCCGKWVEHLRANGFDASVHQVGDVDAVRARAGVPVQLASCHTARIGGYVIEGHVPAADIRRLLAERPSAVGLAVPGMPPAAPGMDMPGAAFDVLLFDAAGSTRIFHSYGRS